VVFWVMDLYLVHSMCECCVLCVTRIGLRQKGVDVWIDIDGEIVRCGSLCCFAIYLYSKGKKFSNHWRVRWDWKLPFTCQCGNFLWILFVFYGFYLLGLVWCYFQFEEISRLFLQFRVEGWDYFLCNWYTNWRLI